MSSKQFYPFKDFQSDQIQRSSRKIFTAHYACRNANLNLTPVTGTNQPRPQGFPLKGKALGTRLGNKSMTPIVLCDCFSNLRLCFENRTKYQPKHRQDCDHDSLY